MKTSISRRLFTTIIAIVLGISTLILLANSLLLKPLYYSSIRGTMLFAVDTLSDINYSEDWETLADEIKERTAGSSYDVVVRTEDEVLYSDSKEFGLTPRPGEDAIIGGEGTGTGDIDNAGTSHLGNEADTSGGLASGEDDEHQNPPVVIRNFGPMMNAQDWEQVDEDTSIGIATEPKTNITMMICVRELSSGVRIILTQAVEPVNQSIQQANILLIACAVITLGLSAIFVFKLSRRFTKPIRQIKEKVGEIAALQFGDPCQIKTGDELESLGSDVNLLGDKLKNALDTLRLQNAQLERDIAAQRQFISNASHELRTPLSLIKGYADEMTAGFAPDVAQKDLYISIIADEAAKMNRLLREMLELTRMESGRVALQNAVLRVKERIQIFLEKYDGYISENGLHITLDGDDDVCGMFDPMFFEQILANYISNAARYGDEKKQVKINVADRGDSVRISVFNSGESISEDKQAHIWDGFYKADSARTRVKDSYGLGLSIVKAMQSASGQQYGVRNLPGGVEFWFDVSRANHEDTLKE